MLFMIQWMVHSEKRHDAYKTFAGMTDADDRADRGNVKLIGRWHDVAAGTGVAICESNDVAAVHAWAMNWNSVLDAEVTAVLDDEAARSLIKSKFGL